MNSPSFNHWLQLKNHRWLLVILSLLCLLSLSSSLLIVFLKSIIDDLCIIMLCRLAKLQLRLSSQWLDSQPTSKCVNLRGLLLLLLFFVKSSIESKIEFHYSFFCLLVVWTVLCARRSKRHHRRHSLVAIKALVEHTYKHTRINFVVVIVVVEFLLCEPWIKKKKQYVVDYFSHTQRFHGDITKEEADARLACRNDGTFLVRVRINCWFDVICFCFVLFWFDLIWFDLIWFDLIWFDLFAFLLLNPFDYRIHTSILGSVAAECDDAGLSLHDFHDK